MVCLMSDVYPTLLGSDEQKTYGCYCMFKIESSIGTRKKFSVLRPKHNQKKIRSHSTKPLCSQYYFLSKEDCKG